MLEISQPEHGCTVIAYLSRYRRPGARCFLPSPRRSIISHHPRMEKGNQTLPAMGRLQLVGVEGVKVATLLT